MSSLEGQEKTDLLGKPPQTEQRKITSEFKCSNNFSTRCINERLGSLLSGSEDWRTMLKDGNKGTYKRTGAESSKVCDICLHKNLPTNENNSFSNGQYSSTILYCQMEAPRTRFYQIKPKKFEIIFYRIGSLFTRNTQCGSRLSVTVSNEFQWMETELTYFKKDLQSLLDSRYRSFWLKNIISSYSILSLQTRPIQKRNKCLSTILGESQGICICSILSHRTHFEKSSSEKFPNNFNKSGMAGMTMVPKGT